MDQFDSLKHHFPGNESLTTSCPQAMYNCGIFHENNKNQGQVARELESPSCSAQMFGSSPETIPPELTFPAFMEVGDISIPAEFFFDHYSHLGENPSRVNEMSSTLILEKAATHLSSYINYNPADMFCHLKNIYSSFQLDEEIFLTALIILYRYMGVSASFLNIKRDSELFYLLTLCVVIAFKGILDSPIDSGAIARSFNLDPSRIFHNEVQIIAALGFSLYYSKENLEPDPGEEETILAEVQSGVVRGRRRGRLSDVFPLEGLMCLTFSAEKPARPNVIEEFEFHHRTAFTTQLMMVKDSFKGSRPDAKVNVTKANLQASPVFTPDSECDDSFQEESNGEEMTTPMTSQSSELSLSLALPPSISSSVLASLSPPLSPSPPSSPSPLSAPVSPILQSNASTPPLSVNLPPSLSSSSLSSLSSILSASSLSVSSTASLMIENGKEADVCNDDPAWLHDVVAEDNAEPASTSNIDESDIVVLGDGDSEKEGMQQKSDDTDVALQRFGLLSFSADFVLTLPFDALSVSVHEREVFFSKAKRQLDRSFNRLLQNPLSLAQLSSSQLGRYQWQLWMLYDQQLLKVKQALFLSQDSPNPSPISANSALSPSSSPPSSPSCSPSYLQPCKPPDPLPSFSAPFVPMRLLSKSKSPSYHCSSTSSPVSPPIASPVSL